MGNTHVKPHPRTRNKKQVHWKAADRPSPPGKPQLAPDNEHTPDLVTIRWTKPIRDGGSPITGYLVEHRRTGSPHWVRATPLLVPFPELTISGLEPGWRYQFRVSAENAVGLSDPSEFSEPLTVTLQKFAITSPKFTDELQDVTALENDKVEFVVRFIAQPAPKVCWFKDGFEIFSSRRTRILTEPDKSILTIHQSALTDEGEIKCTATNKAGHASTKARLTLEAPPSIRLPRQYEDGVLFEIGEVIRLKVSVVGRPTPLVFWTHNGESIQNNDRYEVEYVDKCSVLKVGEAQRSDRGEYQIKAVNKIGEDLASFLVTVTDKPSPPGRARVIMTLGKSVTLSWNIPDDDGGCKIGNYIVEYYRLGWNVWLKAATSRQLTTILGDLIEGSEYKFRVKAESPYGVSDPSEESDVVFIPDAKRGITTPQQRSRSQPKDIIDEIASPPIAARRKNKPRSQSTTKAEISSSSGDSSPMRPERTKIKSPPKSPEVSPRTNRKPVNLLTETIIDRASIARELAYGSPEIKLKKNELDLPHHGNSTSSDRSKSPSPSYRDKKSLSPLPTSKSPSSNQPETSSRTPSPKEKRNLPRENSENFGGSSEFMLVLYPDSNEKGQRRISDIGFNFDDDAIPPPLSLSAPELGAEPPIFENLRPSASSTELLHERAMIRFNEAVAAEQAEYEKRKKVSEGPREIPKIQINSRDNQDIVGLERRHSGRRLSAGGAVQKQVMWAQRRYSLRNSIDLNEVVENKIAKFANGAKDKREIMMRRQRSESEEKEEEEFEKIRAKMALQGQSSFEKRSIEVVDEEKWLEDYEESLSEEETESSEDERDLGQEPKRRIYSDEEEEDVYHPGAIESVKKPSDAPFEILTKPNKLPDPNFVPKPILKKAEDIKETHQAEVRKSEILQPQETSSKIIRSHSPMPQFRKPDEVAGRQRSFSLAQPAVIPPIAKSNTFPSSTQARQRSFSLFQHPENIQIEQDLSRILPESMNIVPPGRNISAVAQLTGLTAASIVISEGLFKKKDDEEAKVVIDHYGDIVRTYSQKRRSISHSTSRSQDSSESVGSPTKSEINESVPFRKSSVISNNSVTSPEFQSDETKVAKSWRKSSITNNSAVVSKIEPPPRPETPQFVAYDTKLPSNARKSSITSNSATLPQSESPIRPETPQFKAQQSSSESLLLQQANRRDKSPSPSPQRKSPTPQRGRSDRKFHRKTSQRSKTPSKSPTRLENWSDRSRKASPSPLKRSVGTTMKKSPSPVPLTKPRPMLREIMTQTSIGLEFEYSSESRTSTPVSRARQEELMAKAEMKVRSVIDYVTDLVMFAVACWLYLFSNELLAIPVLIVMVYRQLKDAVKKRIPKWVVRRWKGKVKK